MRTKLHRYFHRLRETRLWRSAFRSASHSTARHPMPIHRNLFVHVLPMRVRIRILEFGATWYLGILTLGAFALLFATGVPLMLYYHPSVPQAYADTRDLQYVVASGQFLRNLHRWSGHAMVALAFAHMLRVFYRGAYRAPREFNWVIGVVLLLLTLLLSYTGYLLPWDQLAFWAITVGSYIASAIPLAGNKVRFLMLGGNYVDANALLRFYVLHCIILPMAAVFLLTVHFWRIRKDGGLYARQSQAEMCEAKVTMMPAAAAKELSR